MDGSVLYLYIMKGAVVLRSFPMHLGWGGADTLWEVPPLLQLSSLLLWFGEEG